MPSSPRRRLAPMLVTLALIAVAGIGGSSLDASMRRWDALRDVFFHVVADDTVIPDAGTPLSIAQDRAGFIWIATDSGISRWDGRSFRKYDADGRPGSLPEPYVKVVAADAAGRLWVGTSSEGLLRFDPDTETFRRPANATPLDRERIFGIAQGHGGALWVASDGGIARLDGRTLRVDHAAGRRSGLPAGAASAVTQDARGTLWVVVAGRLFRCDAGGRFRTVVLGAAGPDGPAPVATSLLVDRAGRLWVSTVAVGVVLVDSAGRVVRRVSLRPAGSSDPQPMVTTAVEVRPDLLWFDSHQGIIEVDARSFAVRRLHHEPGRVGSLADDSVDALMVDRAGLVWIAAAATLSTADPRPVEATGLHSVLGNGAGGRPYVAWGVDVAPDGRLWLGAQDDPVRILDPGTGAVTRSRTSRHVSAHGMTAFAFAGGPAGAKVFAASESGLFALDPDGRVSRRLSAAPARRLLVVGDTLYIGGSHGLDRIDLRDPRGVPRPALDAARLTNPRVTTLLPASDGAVWIGTVHGLNRFDPASGRLTRFESDMRDPRALGANYINALLFDRRGRLWIGTNGGGADMLERDARGRFGFRHLKRNGGLPNDTVDMLLAGPDGSIWASTDGGIARIDPATFKARALREAEGVQSLAHWQGAGATTRDGDLIFAGTGGLTVIDPAAGHAGTQPAALVATDLKIGTRTLPFDARILAAGIQVPPAAASFSVEFSALDYAAPERIRYAYRLRGFDTGWTRADPAHRTARYTNLPPGDYVLQLRASDRDGRYRGSSLDVAVHVIAAWYQTLAFQGAMLLAFLAACWGLMQFRVHVIRRRERALEQVVENRTAELQRNQRELKKLAYFDALTGLANRRMFAQNMQRLLTPTERQAPAFALILVDLDKFKTVNDTLGHDAGDALLIEAAGRLVSCVRETDSVARLGGDEFAILVSGRVDAESLAVLCDRVIDTVACPILFAHHAIDTSASLGVALFPDNGQTQDEIYKAADLALYAAKRGGRNTWRLFADVAAGDTAHMMHHQMPD